MSLNELVNRQPKSWLNIKCNNVEIDGSLSVTEGIPGSTLTYFGPDDVRFSLLSVFNINNTDYFNIVPVFGFTGGILDMVSSGYPVHNFTLTTPDTLTCTVGGIYLVFLKVTLSSGPYTSRINPYLSINSVDNSASSIRTPLTFNSVGVYSGLQAASLQNFSIGDTININAAVQPAGTVNMMNTPYASDIILIKIA